MSKKLIGVLLAVGILVVAGAFFLFGEARKIR